MIAPTKVAFDTPLSPQGLPNGPGSATGHSGDYPDGTHTRRLGPAFRTQHDVSLRTFADTDHMHAPDLSVERPGKPFPVSTCPAQPGWPVTQRHMGEHGPRTSFSNHGLGVERFVDGDELQMGTVISCDPPRLKRQANFANGC